MLQLWDCKPTPIAMTNVAAIAVLLASYFGFTIPGKATEVHHPQTQHETGDGFVPTGKGWGERDRAGTHGNTFSRGTYNGISYHKGPLIIPARGPINVYYIWYGNWPTTNTATTILPNLVGPNGIGGSPYFNINTTYSNWSGQKVLNSVLLAKQTTDTYSQGPNLSDSQVQAVVSTAIN